MHKNSRLWLIPAIVVALLASWLHSLWIDKQQFIARIDKTRIDYYLSDFSLLKTDSNGEMSYHLQASHFVHQVASKQSEIFKPSIEAKQKDDTISIRADRALHFSAGDIELAGQVHIQKPETREASGFHLETEDLTYSPREQTIATRGDFVIKTSQGDIIQGKGVSENLNNQVLRIKSNVHVTYKNQNN